MEFSPRFGYDAIYCLLTLIKGSLTEFFLNGFQTEFYDGFASSQRITIPPFPYADKELLNAMAKDILIKNKLEDFWMEDVYMDDKGNIRCAGSDGIIGVVAERGNSLGGSVGNVYRKIDKLKIGSYIQYRTDLGKSQNKRMKQLQEWGFKIF